MRIMCLIKRKGGTAVQLRENSYHFKPEADGRHIADVDDADVEAFLAAPEAYCLADEGATAPVKAPEPEVKSPENPELVPPADTPDNSSEPEQEATEPKLAPASEPEPAKPGPEAEEQVVPAASLEELSEDDLDAEYATVFGKPPHHSAKPASKIAKIREALALSGKDE